MNTKIITSAFAALIALSMAGNARAALAEGFESGFGPGDAVIGDASIKASYFGINAAQGSDQLLLTTINSASGQPDANASYTNQSGNNAVDSTNLASFFSVSPAAIKNGSTTGKEGSGFQINLGMLNSGQTIQFDYDFLTQEPNNGTGNGDFAFYTLTGQSGTNAFSDVTFAVTTTPGNTDPFGSHTGYHTFVINITKTGSYTLGLGVADAGNPSSDNAPSALLIDNIVTTVPEPSTVGLIVFGAIGLVAATRRFKNARR
jgi:hypothetical protein